MGEKVRFGILIFTAQQAESAQTQNQMLGAACETIKAPDQHSVKASLLGIVHQLIEGWTVRTVQTLRV